LSSNRVRAAREIIARQENPVRLALCSFSLVGEPHRLVTVNTSRISHFEMLDDGKTTTIFFDKDHSVTVTAHRQEVEDEIRREEERLQEEGWCQEEEWRLGKARDKEE
jgi:hypothetical protein